MFSDPPGHFWKKKKKKLPQKMWHVVMCFGHSALLDLHDLFVWFCFWKKVVSRKKPRCDPRKDCCSLYHKRAAVLRPSWFLFQLTCLTHCTMSYVCYKIAQARNFIQINCMINMGLFAKETKFWGHILHSYEACFLFSHCFADGMMKSPRISAKTLMWLRKHAKLTNSN